MKYSKKLFQILIQSVALFQLSSSAGVTIISYPELGHDFVEFMNEYKYRNDEFLDPYSEEVQEDLRRVCRDIKFARTFELMAQDAKETRAILDYTRAEDITSSHPYEDINVKIVDLEDDLPMFPCYKSSAFGYVYVTPGFTEEFKFLFKQANERSNPILYALVEPRPVVDETFHDRRHLEKYFVNAYRMYEEKSKNQLSLSSLNGHQHYRLCSLLEDARRMYEQEMTASSEGEEDDYLGIEEKHQLGAEEMYEITFQELDKSNLVYATLEVYVATLPCFTDNGNLTFLVSENPKDPNSVFVLEKRINIHSRKREVFVVHHVRDIALLRQMDKFYKK